jgi:hypothetical protein
MVFIVEEFYDVRVTLADFFNLSQYSRIGLQAGGRAADGNFLFRSYHALQGNFTAGTAHHEGMSPVEKLETKAIDARDFYRDSDFDVLICTLSLCFHIGPRLDQETHF